LLKLSQLTKKKLKGLQNVLHIGKEENGEKTKDKETGGEIGMCFIDYNLHFSKNFKSSQKMKKKKNK